MIGTLAIDLWYGNIRKGKNAMIKFLDYAQNDIDCGQSGILASEKDLNK